MEVPASKIDDAEAVVADTERLIDDEDGSYEWDGSYVSVRGTLQPMEDVYKRQPVTPAWASEGWAGAAGAWRAVITA